MVNSLALWYYCSLHVQLYLERFSIHCVHVRGAMCCSMFGIELQQKGLSFKFHSNEKILVTSDEIHSLKDMLWTSPLTQPVTGFSKLLVNVYSLSTDPHIIKQYFFIRCRSIFMIMLWSFNDLHNSAPRYVWTWLILLCWQ